jgi:DNA polymerase-3 subunit chi
MLVDFYQLGERSNLEQVVASIAQKVLAEDQRLLIVADDEGLLGRLDRALWDHGPASFLPHAIAGGADDTRQPILLAASVDAPNLARKMLIADGEGRAAALTFHRAFYICDEGGVEAARLAWKLLSGRDEVERRYWANEDGRWVHKA